MLHTTWRDDQRTPEAILQDLKQELKSLKATSKGREDLVRGRMKRLRIGIAEVEAQIAERDKKRGEGQ